MKTRREYELGAREAIERLDVLEEDALRETCSVHGCRRTGAIYAVAGAFRTFYVCSRHRPLYREHARIVDRIRRLRDRGIVI